MPKQTFNLSDEASVLLKQYWEKLKESGNKVTYNDIVSEAVRSYCLSEQRGRAEEIFEKTMEYRFQKYENRLASMVAAVGVDVCMILNETLEDRAALDENRNKEPRQVYSELREAGVSLFKRHKAFKVDVLK